MLNTSIAGGDRCSTGQTASTSGRTPTSHFTTTHVHKHGYFNPKISNFSCRKHARRSCRPPWLFASVESKIGEENLPETGQFSEFNSASMDEQRRLHKEAMALSRSGSQTEALDLLEEGLDKYPENIYFLTSAGVIEGELGRVSRARELFSKGVEVDPKNSTTLQAWGVLEAREGRLDAAADLFNQSCTANPNQISSFQMWGILEAQRNNMKLARDLFESANRLNDKHLPTLHAWASAELKSGNKKTAQGLLERVLKLDPSNIQATLSLGQLYWSRGNLNTTRKIFKQCYKKLKDPQQRANILNHWASLEAKRGNTGNARHLFTTALKNKPNHIHTLVAFGSLLARGGNTKKAQKLYEMAEKCKPGSVFVKHSLAQFYRQIGKKDKARLVLNELLGKNKGCGIGWFTLGELLMEDGDMESAKDCFMQGARSKDAKGSLLCYEGLAGIALFEGKGNIARDYFKEGLQYHRPTGRYLRMWALMEKKLSNTQVASDLFRSAYQINPHDVRTWLQWALHERALGNYTQAEYCLTRALEIAPKRPVLWITFVTTLRNKGDDAAARQALEKALEKCPKSGPLLLEFALLEWDSEDYEAARKLFKQGADLPTAIAHPPIFEAWDQMERELGNTDKADEIRKSYNEILEQRDEFLQKKPKGGATTLPDV